MLALKPSITLITETSLYKCFPKFAPYIWLKWLKSGVGIKMTKTDEFQNFTIKSYVVDVF